MMQAIMEPEIGSERDCRFVKQTQSKIAYVESGQKLGNVGLELRCSSTPYMHLHCQRGVKGYIELPAAWSARIP